MAEIASVAVSTKLVRVEGGKIHITYEIGGRVVDDPRCNLDDAARRSSISDTDLSEADPAQLCAYCFGTED